MHPARSRPTIDTLPTSVENGVSCRPRHPTRRTLLSLGAGALAFPSTPARAQRVAAPAPGSRIAPPGDAVHEWETFRDRFVAPEGRVVDTGNRGVSHSEGQGIGMLAAAQWNDRATFDRLRAWTGATLRRDQDSLHAWRYRPGAATPVDDPNNATDGDLLIAYALVKGADRWGEPSLRAQGRAVARDILRLLTVETPAGLVLLPGAAGFRSTEHVTVNPSYYIFPVIQRLSEEWPDPAWARLWMAGLTLLRDARFGRWKLPPDWLAIPQMPGPAKPADPWPARFSFDAVRVPLYLAWAGLADHPAVGAVGRFWADHPDDCVPAWADLSSDDVAAFPQSSGMVAVRRYVGATLNGRVPLLPAITATTDYYAAALTLLTRVALEVPFPSA